MGPTTSAALTRDLETLFHDGTSVGLADRELVARFADRRDPSAFEALVRRHGPMVLRVCSNALVDPNDAHDAFQATFLVLVRRCGAVRGLESLGGWLYGVACRVAARARVEAARRRAIDGRAALRVVGAVDPADADAIDHAQLGPILNEEVGRLPRKYREAIVLCYWEGLTHEQAAARLGCPLGTVRSRIARARDLLRRRLTRRGVDGSGIDVTSAIPVVAALPDAWIVDAVQPASQCGAGGGLAAIVGVSSTVITLARDVLRSFLIMKLKTTAICVTLIGLGAAGAIVAAPQAGRERPTTAESRRPRGEEKPGRRSAPASETTAKKSQPSLQSLEEYVVEPPDIILVEVLEALPGRPISGERLVRPDGKISLGFYGDVYVAGLTISEVKERIVEHLRKFLADDTLGLVEMDQKGRPRHDADGKPITLASRLLATDRVFVEVSKSNSKFFYVLGAVQLPGRMPITGHETVLDAINQAGGLLANADHRNVVLYRTGKDRLLQKIAINIDEITLGDDPTTNYQLLPGDRLVIPSRPGAAPDGEARDERPTARGRTETPAPRRRDEAAVDGAAIRDLERRLEIVERKLDRMLQALEGRER